MRTKNVAIAIAVVVNVILVFVAWWELATWLALKAMGFGAGFNAAEIDALGSSFARDILHNQGPGAQSLAPLTDLHIVSETYRQLIGHVARSTSVSVAVLGLLPGVVVLARDWIRARWLVVDDCQVMVGGLWRPGRAVRWALTDTGWTVLCSTADLAGEPSWRPVEQVSPPQARGIAWSRRAMMSFRYTISFALVLIAFLVAYLTLVIYTTFNKVMAEQASVSSLTDLVVKTTGAQPGVEDVLDVRSQVLQAVADSQNTMVGVLISVVALGVATLAFVTSRRRRGELDELACVHLIEDEDDEDGEGRKVLVRVRRIEPGPDGWQARITTATPWDWHRIVPIPRWPLTSLEAVAKATLPEAKSPTTRS